MRAQNLTICVPCQKDKRCDKNCEYCISLMTWWPALDEDLMKANFEKALTVSRAAQTTNVLLTGKGEPFLNLDWIFLFAEKFKVFPLEIQTNGIWLNNNQGILKELRQAGLDVIAFSIDKLGQLNQYGNLFENVVQHKMTVRVCLNITNMIPLDLTFDDIFSRVTASGHVRQVLIRNIMSPSGVESGKQYEWIKANVKQGRYAELWYQFKDIVLGRKPDEVLPFGMEVYTLNGASVSFSDYCIQEYHTSDDIRSLIFHHDGHVYKRWSDPASILF